jgi:hypothetical protein
MIDFSDVWSRALSYKEFADASEEHCKLWEGMYAIARVPAWAHEAVPADAGVRLLAITEDWCGDGPSTLAIVAKLADRHPGLELRLIRRDENPEVMDRYLTNGSRSIPIVVALDRDFQELGHWGPRPSVLQAWVAANKATMPKSELYPEIRKWYARDRGESTLKEVLAMAVPAITSIPKE